MLAVFPWEQNLCISRSGGRKRQRMVLGEGKDDREQGGELGAGGCPDVLVPAPLPPQRGSSPWVGSCQEGQGSRRGSGSSSQYCSHPIPPSTSSLTKT